MTRTTVSSALFRIATVCVAAAALAACGGGGGGGGSKTDVTPPPPAASALEDQFGVNFGSAFRVVNNADPKDPAPGDIIPICFTCDPVNIP